MADSVFISIIIPCRNEEKYIGRCLDSLLANDYLREDLEIVIVDGMSTDRTREMLQYYCHKYTFIKMIDNPWHIKPKALNIGIKSTSSDVIMRIDAHTFYPINYISSIISGLMNSNADNYGGIIEIIPSHDTILGKALSFANSHFQNLVKRIESAGLNGKGILK